MNALRRRNEPDTAQYVLAAPQSDHAAVDADPVTLGPARDDDGLFAEMRLCGLSRGEHGGTTAEAEGHGGVNRKGLRDDWTRYAETHGLINGLPSAKADDDVPTPAKYGNVRVQVDGHWFDSKKEAQRYNELKLMRQAKQIAELELHPVFPLHVMELHRSQVPIQITTVGMFAADFRYVDLTTGEIVVEDVKSEATKTTAYKLRKRIAEAVHGMHVREL